MPQELERGAVLAVALHPGGEREDRIVIGAVVVPARGGEPDGLALHAREELPPADRRRVGAEPARRFPEADRLLLREEATGTVVPVPAPDAVDPPGEVLEGIAEMRELPVEDAADRP